MKKSLILSFDYELFLGNPSGTVGASIIEPTDRLLKLFDKYQKKGVFFIDATYLVRCKKDAPQDFALVAKQVASLHKKGHEIGLHLHPHWSAAAYNEGQWSFSSFKNYRLHSLREEQIDQIFKDSIQVLTEIVNDPQYQPRVFRAGGWCLQPFSTVKPYFIKYGLEIDSSVNIGAHQATSSHQFDYRNAPRQEIWKFSDDPVIPVKNANFYEVPVTSLELPSWYLVVNKLILRMSKDKPFGDGKGLYVKDSSGRLISRLFKFNIRPFSIEGTSGWLMRAMLKRSQNQLVQFVMHPKTCSNLALKNLEYLLENFETLTLSEVVKNKND